jgi:hypothetical protein
MILLLQLKLMTWLRANGESWDTIVDDEVDGAVLDSEVDDTEDAEVDTYTMNVR